MNDPENMDPYGPQNHPLYFFYPVEIAEDTYNIKARNPDGSLSTVFEGCSEREVSMLIEELERIYVK